MIRKIGFTFCAVVLLALAAPSAFALTQEEVVEGAKKEGELSIHVGPGQAFRDGRLKGFSEKYPFLKVNAINTANRESMPKLIRERQSGIYALDVHFGGSPNLIRVYKPQGFMSPFRDAIYMPELMDDSKWRDGFGGGFQDKEGKLIFGYNAVATNPGHYNKARLKKSEFSKMEDLLSPKNASRIVWHDPRSPGPGFATAMAIYYNYGEEFLIKLLKLQGPVYTNNRRQAAEFVVRGRYPIGLGTSRDFMVMFEKEGLTKNVEEFPDEWLAKPTMSSGNGNVVLIDKAPHPYAAKLYINWFLQQEQQQQWNKETDGASRRLDTKPNKPDLAPKPGKTYIDIFHENQANDVAKVLKIARDTITATPDKDDD